MQEPSYNPSFGSGATEAPTPPSPQTDSVYTMPDRFRAAAAPPSGGGGRRRWILWLGIGAVIVAGAGAGSYFLFQRLPGTANGNTNVVTVNTANANRTNASGFSTNANENANRAVNGSTTNTVNGNANANVSVNSTTNATANANTNTNTNANVNTNTAPQPRSSPLPSSLDTDSDGLTDMEETQMYATDPNKPDTDGDGFVDGKQTTDNGIVGEVYLGYHPNGSGRLSASTLVKKYENAAYAYSVLSPATWTATEVDALKKNVFLSPPSSVSSGEFFQVSIQENSAQVTPKQWYVNLNPGIDAAQVQEATVNGILGAWSLDGQTLYLGKGETMYILTYSSGTLTQVNFRTTFEMVTQSFLLTGTPQDTNS